MSDISNININYLGFGLGFRPVHFNDLFPKVTKIDWLEILTEDFLAVNSHAQYCLNKITEKYPIVLHGVSLSIGGTDELNWDYLKQIKQLVDRYHPHWISDHLCWSSHRGVYLHDLMPLPYTYKIATHIAERIKKVQDYLGQRLILENVSSYVTYTISEMTEWEFMTEIVTQADCRLLLDINNIYVSSVNHQFSPLDYLAGIPKNCVQQFHLAGHRKEENYLIDTHDHPIPPMVLELYKQAVARFGKLSTSIERDDRIPSLNRLITELELVRSIINI